MQGARTLRVRRTPLQLGRDPQIAEIVTDTAAAWQDFVLQLGRDPQIAEIPPTRSNWISTGTLQLGRDPQIAEILTCHSWLERASVASIGPRSSDRGNGGYGLDGGVEGAASIGPRSSDRGNMTTAMRAPPCSSASIGPRSSDRGNMQRPEVRHDRSNRFNWAAILRSRKSALGPYVRQNHRASIGPRSSDRGNVQNMSPATEALMLQLGRDPQIAEMDGAAG